ncbi:MAG: DUF616 domain-containing protein [Desulfobulbus sp.]|nr:DUF616 domain-containing protein [Desulfobulbus sp.]
MNFYRHIKEITAHRSGADKIALARGVALNVFNYLIMRPTIARIVIGRKYKQERKLFYTVLTGDYDLLNEIPEKLNNWEYICFTDNPRLKSNTWKIVQIENNFNLDPRRLSRVFKIKNYLVDSEYDISVYADANIKIRGNLDAFIAQALRPHSALTLPVHPFLNSLEGEYKQCLAVGKDQRDILESQYNFYTKDQRFSDSTPHVNARLLIRRTGNSAINTMMDLWFEQLMQWSRRDQMSFNYVLNMCRDVNVDYFPYWIFRRYFKVLRHR